MPPRLKSLELQGYKTFASRTVFEFPVDITAIVGPNGAGKSNVADAIRWVLGEQAYSILRGRKTVDMIFAGSEQRPRASMAAATIGFDNENNWLPIDFSEVSITRRAYRDGQNEYLLNGQRVRLKETSELLAQSGLAERTYTIIGQGLVDAALSLKPEERRRFFEEAAGIGLYRKRREEALNRLANTQRNLERVNDILSEIKPRLRSLEKQAHRSKEYERVQADLQLSLHEWYGYHWHQTQQELRHAREVLKTQRNRLDQVCQRKIEVDEKISALRDHLQQLRKDLNGWHAQSSVLHRDREKISRFLAVLDERHRALLSQKQNLNSDLNQIIEELQFQNERMKTYSEEYDCLKTKLVEAQNQVDIYQTKYNERVSEREQVNEELQRVRHQLTTHEKREVELNIHHAEMVSRVEELRTSYLSLIQSQESIDIEIKKAQTRFDLAAQNKSALEIDFLKAKKKLQDHRRSEEKVEKRRRAVQDEILLLETERVRLKTRLDVLEQTENSFNGINRGSRFILEAAREGHLPDGYSLFGDQIEVPKEYEIAIASLLGEYLNGILVDPKTNPEQAFLMLENGDKGRAVFLLLDFFKANQRIKSPEDVDVIANAADIVSTPRKLQSLIHALLEQVLIVRNRAAARRLIPSLPATARVVTLRGEIFWGNGVVIAGQDGSIVKLARPRHKRELRSNLLEVEKQLDQLTIIIRQIDDEMNLKQDQKQRMVIDFQKIEKKADKKIQLHQKANLELEKSTQQSEWQLSKLADIEKQISQIDEENNNILCDIEDIASKHSSLRDQVQERNRQLITLPLTDIQAQFAHWETNVAVYKKAVEDAEKRMEEHKVILAHDQKLKGALHKRLDDALIKLEQLETDKVEQRNEEDKLNEKITGLIKQIGPAENKLEILESEYILLQDSQLDAQQDIAASERYVTKAQLELSRQREALDHLRNRIEDDFGLVALEYANDVSGPTPLPLGEMVEKLPVVKQISNEIEDNIRRQRALLRRLGPINPETQKEYEIVYERYEFITNQVEDLKEADADLRKVIDKLDDLMRKKFCSTFDAVAVEFRKMFTRLFGGGTARIILVDENNPMETGIDIEARLPGRREQGLSLLSGGERSLTSVALIFSLLKTSPTPFCVLDEVDAMLDEANVDRFCELLRELSLQTQFIIITHNRKTVQTADVIYGVTRGRDSASQVISLKLDEVSDEMIQ